MKARLYGPRKMGAVECSDPVQDLVQIRRLGEKKRDENARFRLYLKSHDYSDRRFRRAAEEIERKVDCRACAN